MTGSYGRDFFLRFREFYKHKIMYKSISFDYLWQLSKWRFKNHFQGISFLKKHLFLFIWTIELQRETQRESSLQVYFPKDSRSQGRSRPKPGSAPGSPTWMARHSSTSIIFYCFPNCVSRELGCKLNRRDLKWHSYDKLPNSLHHNAKLTFSFLMSSSSVINGKSFRYGGWHCNAVG